MKKEKLYLYNISSKYVAELHKLDKHVFYHHGLHDRPYVGILIKLDNFNYFAPLGSPKKKHKKINENITFSKINYRNQFLGVINFNNMIPAPKSMFPKINIQKIEDSKYSNLLSSQLRAIQKHSNKYKHKANILRMKVKKHELESKQLEICNDFETLERHIYIVEEKLLKFTTVNKNN
ncbi:type III toxin-antitoxin system ToxN/AbiQ family toxin [Lactobacillus jensenii]|uniref:type III toxin-antitoxin system ToxN/AbiQ family toxin n=1 Tax=Lactobacillus jensenii TaxID=109790 RepID=UPI0029C44170|nr:type III toxin-antitoxin system ToxN/AbiQ family toxin [Lactobacillus jensenii]MDX5103228.1 type III toxin-antitoxin system ToxN/AbiQ family toxin [Lactobacillus jensenii]MDX5104757.1 type III toxin-antitoxin system ToxN/AbiQ family toxin [Lactobacillus jensenii]MDX5115527.1 type III toxin-antitoxin system ToxN/AbiQ family toxin [Lactobacillus jensenii]